MLLALGLVSGPGAVPAAAQLYSVTDLGPVGANTAGASSTGAFCFAQRLPDGTSQVVIADGAGLHPLPSGGRDVRPCGINSRGQVAGELQGHATVWDGTGARDLNPLMGGSSSITYGINDAGQIVGSGEFGAGDTHGHAFLYDGTGIHNLGVLGSGATSEATGINNHGQIVGASGPGAAAPGWRAFLYDSAGIHDLGTPPGYSDSLASAINDAGQVVGYVSGAGGERPFLWQNGVMTLLDGQGEARSINAAGQVIGNLQDGTLYGAIWQDGHMHKLDDLLLPDDRDWSVDAAWVINNAGQILASGYHPNGDRSGRTVLLTPVPVPQLRLSVDHLEFGNEIIGAASAAQTVRLTNIGQAALTVSGLRLDGANPTAFAIVKDSGETTLPPGASRTVEISFTPTVMGNRGAGLFVSDDDPDPHSPSVVALTGTGIAPLVSLSPASLSFGDQVVGASGDLTVSLSNMGSAPLLLQKVSIDGTDAAQFSVTDPGAVSLAPGQSQTLHVRFTPTARGSATASLVIASNAPSNLAQALPVTTSGSGTSLFGNPARVPLTGSGLAPVASLSPSALNFGAQALGALTDAQSVTLQNTGDALLDVRSVSITGANSGDFKIVADGWTGAHLLPGQIATLNLRFSPTAAGDRSARLSLTDNALGGPPAVDLSGAGTTAGVSLSATHIDFADQVANTTSAEQTVTLTNSGSAPLTLGTLTLSGSNPGDFTAAADPGGLVLAPGESRTVHLRFRPTAPGSRTASLAINDNAAGSPQILTLSGRGTMPSVTFGISRLAGPGSMSFGSQPLGASSSPQTLTLTNSGTAPLTISRLEVQGADAGDFAISGESGAGTLAPGAARTITLQFTPTALGDRTASLIVTDDAAGGQQTVTLTGRGALPRSRDGGAELIPTGLELVIAASAGGDSQIPAGSPGKPATVTPGQPVTLRLLAKFANGAVADVTQDSNSYFGASPALGSFTGKSVWSAGATDAGRTVTFYARYFSPLGRKRLVATAQIVVTGGRRSHR